LDLSVSKVAQLEADYTHVSPTKCLPEPQSQPIDYTEAPICSQD